MVAYYAAITSGKSMTIIVATVQQIEETQNGSNADIQSVRAALQGKRRARRVSAERRGAGDRCG